MTDKQLATASRASAFLPADTRDAHIIDVLIEERCPSFVEHWTWPVMRPLLLGALGYNKARRMADRISGMSGVEAFDFLSDALNFQIKRENSERVPSSGRVIIAANHPTGLADGVAVWETLRDLRDDVVFFANADAIRVNRRFEEAIIPVEWVLDKRSPAKTRETLRRAAEAFAEEKCVVIFPSGKLAKMIDGRLTEHDWFSTVIGLARKQKAPVVPLHVDAKNSPLYYFLSRVNGELRDITLFHELLNKRGSRFGMRFGPLIEPEALQGDPATTATALRDYVSYDMAGDPHTPFRMTI